MILIFSNIKKIIGKVTNHHAGFRVGVAPLAWYIQVVTGDSFVPYGVQLPVCSLPLGTGQPTLPAQALQNALTRPPTPMICPSFKMAFRKGS
jgi:hypothetical protein